MGVAPNDKDSQNDSVERQINKSQGGHASDKVIEIKSGDIRRVAGNLDSKESKRRTDLNSSTFDGQVQDIDGDNLDPSMPQQR